MVAAQSLHGEVDATKEKTDSYQKGKTDVGVDDSSPGKKEEIKDEVPDVPVSMLAWAISLSRPEWLALSLGVLGAVGEGEMICCSR